MIPLSVYWCYHAAPPNAATNHLLPLPINLPDFDIPKDHRTTVIIKTFFVSLHVCPKDLSVSICVTENVNFLMHGLKKEKNKLTSVPSKHHLLNLLRKVTQKPELPTEKRGH